MLKITLLLFRREMPKAKTQGTRRSLSAKFCSCEKKVKAAGKVSNPVPICVKSVLQTRGRTLKRFSCGGKPRLITQAIKLPKVKDSTKA